MKDVIIFSIAWSAAIYILVSLWLLGENQKKWGWIYNLIGSSLFVIYGWDIESYQILFLNCMFVIMATINLLKFYGKKANGETDS